MMQSFIESIALRGKIDRRSYLYHIPAVRYLTEHEVLGFETPVTFFVGENGTGKSTLLEAIAVACGFNPEGGSRNFRFSTRDSHSSLGDLLTISRTAYAKDGFFLRAESLYNAASYIDELDEQPSFDPPVIQGYGGVSLHEQSHGESFLAIVHNRFRGHGLYLLDEPEAALSPMRQLTLLAEIDRLVKADSQLIIATHSPMLMAYPGAQVYAFSENGITSADYRETEHFLIMRDFLACPERMLRHLLGEDA